MKTKKLVLVLAIALTLAGAAVLAYARTISGDIEESKLMAPNNRRGFGYLIN